MNVRGSFQDEKGPALNKGNEIKLHFHFIFFRHSHNKKERKDKKIDLCRNKGKKREWKWDHCLVLVSFDRNKFFRTIQPK
jgi:hypothetical protein